LSVLQSEAVKALEKFANEHSQTQGKFTIGDEKKHNVFMRPQVRRLGDNLPMQLEIVLTSATGP
jgi:hypothetical protein